MDIKDQPTVLSLIVPVHNEEDTIQIFYDAIQKIKPEVGATIDFHFIDDGSTDKTLPILRDLVNRDSDVHYVSFSRNFGKEAGLYAGLQQAKGDYVAVMDVDLQDPPELLPQMLSEVQSGEYDAVGTRRADRKGEAKLRSWFSAQFYKWMNKISQTHLVDGARDYRVMTRQMVNAILSLSENQRFSKGIFTWVGFRTKYIPYENRERVAGTTSWSFWKLTKYAIEGIVSFSTMPLTIVTFLGLLSFGASIVAGIFIVIRALISNSSVAGWPSMVTIILFIGGIQMLSLGIIGRYIAAIFMETKNRPIYIAKEEK
ncbi:glycosyltransferase family 2 protein [Fructobacillus evanidus]|uniref:Glycosyltransferase involved in cell wall bisynthesis (WcaA) n=1 Tax=Fructobacillus evanidus TaxID=3064281 RepID=A0ABN9Z042_9LACO|nr:Glycosyltransferase involved in cell wall bisynthesis (WcaA) [Fructobacillus sp. LMG 32999]CAK1250555.1 Glycosyltransferase involved in cell wall bisynthesis (WcaA) [Fructobacillus sp. LMG 32999]CAK1254278.1 Glycosyltransferase involved in cell wall bisynthesis (WcaA) [Fructobacillus sp. LMG 32999]CAK1254372.1 Glycosyltransferase involved in cell wall bisynthesis (WcaA) [Fructobacillus sp. LMG 32999]CAK1254716.1 Glycosyltransferase involved in cell wall bisynthesis (WcaA) [Fructobacillus sp.